MYFLNIGLNNNPMTYGQIVDDLKQFGLDNRFNPVIKMGEWDENPEPTIVAVVDKITKSDLGLLCQRYTQQAIAVYDPNFGDGHLVYDPDFDGEKYQFDRNYFLFP